ncbi:hypothetical protein [Streptomyces sp. NPDC002328]|uniref:hypothetical protein n=1 Tax=Streptomyces sp. NPDC002328 TaxID=3364642 RepID=UPI0036B1AE87
MGVGPDPLTAQGVLTVTAQISRRITVAEFLVRRGLPADWPYGSPLGRVAARLYREAYGHEPSTAFRVIHGRFRRVMAYRSTETHILTSAWELYGSTAGQFAARPAQTRRTPAGWPGSADSMRWTPPGGPVRSHP